MANPAQVDPTMWTSLLHAGLAGSFMGLPEIAPRESDLREAGAGAAIYGLPFDSGSIGRSGANYGPRGIRGVSYHFKPYCATFDFDLGEALHPCDCGDCAVVPGNAQRTFERAQEDIAQILAAGALPVTLGGDHAITIPAVRAVREHVADPGLVLLDLHLDTALDVAGERLNHCCPIARAVEAGFDPAKIALLGISGWLNPRSELDFCREHGIAVIWLEEIWERARDHARCRRRRLPVLRRRLSRRGAHAGHLHADPRRALQPRSDRARARARRRRPARRRHRRDRADARAHARDSADGGTHRGRGDGLPRGRRRAAAGGDRAPRWRLLAAQPRGPLPGMACQAS
jgi:hypothetical protein